jgi:hypothetical protein
MDKDDLRECFRREVDRWSAMPFDALLAGLAEVVAYTGEGPDFYQVEVQLLECEPEYVHVAVAVDDGGWRAFVPLSASFLVYRDGRIEKPSL